MELKEVLNKATAIIDTYESGEWLKIDTLRELLRQLTKCHYQLTKVNIESYREHNAMLYNFDGSVARANIEADKEIPELRMSRKILESIDHVLWSMRSEISILKRD